MMGSVLLCVGDVNWNPAGWLNDDAVGWDKLGSYSSQTIEALRVGLHDSGIFWLVFGMVMVIVAIAIGRLALEKL